MVVKVYVRTLDVMLRANDDCWCGSGKKYKRCHKLQLGAWRVSSHPSSRCRPRSNDPTTSSPTARLGTRESMVKDPDVIERMRKACRIADDILEEVGTAVAPGVTRTRSTASCTRPTSRAAPSRPAPLQRLPQVVCTSVNEVVCHGIPDERALSRGDIVNLRHHHLHQRRPRRHLRHLLRRPPRSGAAKHVASPRNASPTRSVRCAPAPRSPTSGAPSRSTPRGRASPWSGPSSATASARSSTGRLRCRTSRNAARPRRGGMTFTIEPMITWGHRPAHPARQVDGADADRTRTVVRAHGPRHLRRLRRPLPAE